MISSALSPADRESATLAFATVRRIASLCGKKSLIALLEQRRESLLGFCAPELHEPRAWQAAYEALLLAWPGDPPEAALREWEDAEQKRRDILSTNNSAGSEPNLTASSS